MRKNVGLIILLILISLGVVGCSGGSYTITVGEIDSLSNEMSGEYKSFSGYYFKKIGVEKGEILSVTFSVETEEGELLAKIIDSEGRIVKTITVGEEATIHEPGEYKLQVEGTKHKGSFLLTWELES